MEGVLAMCVWADGLYLSRVRHGCKMIMWFTSSISGFNAVADLCIIIIIIIVCAWMQTEDTDWLDLLNLPSAPRIQVSD